MQCDKCRDRWCIPCQVEKRYRLQKNIRNTPLPLPIRFLTLTLRSNRDALSVQIKRIYRSFRLLRQKPPIRNCLRGGVFFLELTLNRDTTQWHPHLHILFSGQYLPVELVRKHWHRITGDSYVVDVRAVANKDVAAAYVTKYVSKQIPAHIYFDPDALDEAVLALRGVRQFQTFGTWKKFRLADEPYDPDEWENVGRLDVWLQRRSNGDEDANAVMRAVRFTSPIGSDDG